MQVWRSKQSLAREACLKAGLAFSDPQSLPAGSTPSRIQPFGPVFPPARMHAADHAVAAIADAGTGQLEPRGAASTAPCSLMNIVWQKRACCRLCGAAAAAGNIAAGKYVRAGGAAPAGPAGAAADAVSGGASAAAQCSGCNARGHRHGAREHLDSPARRLVMGDTVRNQSPLSDTSAVGCYRLHTQYPWICTMPLQLQTFQLLPFQVQQDNLASD